MVADTEEVQAVVVQEDTTAKGRTLAPPAMTVLNRFGPMVQAEMDEERRVGNERLKNWPLQRLQNEGLVLLGLRGKKKGNFFVKAVRVFTPAGLVLLGLRGMKKGNFCGKAVLVFTPAGLVLLGLRGKKKGNFFGKAVLVFTPAVGGDLPFHRLTSGDVVMLSQGNPLTEKIFEGTLLDRGRWEAIYGNEFEKHEDGVGFTLVTTPHPGDVEANYVSLDLSVRYPVGYPSQQSPEASMQWHGEYRDAVEELIQTKPQQQAHEVPPSDLYRAADGDIPSKSFASDPTNLHGLHERIVAAQSITHVAETLKGANLHGLHERIVAAQSITHVAETLKGGKQALIAVLPPILGPEVEEWFSPRGTIPASSEMQLTLIRGGARALLQPMLDRLSGTAAQIAT
eukprot:gene18412-24886_t